jgi:hypothetical protein
MQILVAEVEMRIADLLRRRNPSGAISRDSILESVGGSSAT